MTDKTIDHRLAWLAGIIDGEGYVRFNTERVSTQRRGGRVWYYTAYHVEVANTDSAMLNEIMAIADVLGVKYGYYPRVQYPGRKPQHRVSFHSRASCDAILRAVLPYLVTKRPQAELMLRALVHRARTGHHWRDPEFIPVRQDEEFSQLETELRTLNRRGVRHPNDVRWNESLKKEN